MMSIIILSLLTYGAMIFFTRYRTPIAMIGAASLLIYGSVSDVFPADLAFEKFPKEIFILIIVLALFSKIFEENGVFEYLEHLLIRRSKGRKISIIVLLVAIMYVASLFMNNLSVILMFTFICLKIALKLNLPVVPLLVAGIISSNIGGAALAWSDTPAVILTLYTDFTLMDFIKKLFLPCALYMVLLSAYTVLWCKHVTRTSVPTRKHFSHRLPHEKIPPLSKSINDELVHKLNWNKIKLPIIWFVLFILGICIGPFLDISIAYISMFFGALLLITNKNSPENIINSIPVLESLLFIMVLFFIGGILEYSGITSRIVEYIFLFTGENKYLMLISIMVSAFLIATFLSAGPAAATLLPICTDISPVIGNNLVYAALALGILAGSSMLPWSATGGPIMLGEVNRFLKKYQMEHEVREQIMEIFNLKSYLAFSIPFSFIILILSGVFLGIYLIVF
ncbi:SLC13 family permease [Clostridium sp. ZS2-4]|uniref:SLC13 family permease n=1 Tax=Clostridium sp. ZS2-4 TaxID=2987703 RepID=UPI00227A5312|nr:SLC13 family permease [Clostridium sp. ZS2-4]MCY6354998.1 SLC13 family permease [Clostridium sp. ZS2-4]